MEDEILNSTRVNPHWLPSGDQFWYRLKQPENVYEFVLVDCAQKTRLAGLSEVALVEEVERRTGAKPDLAVLATNDARWKGSFDNEKMTGTFPDEEIPSPYAATAVSVSFVNNSSHVLSVYWIDHAADAVLRGTVEVGEFLRLTTWQGHIWRVCAKEKEEACTMLYAAPKEDDNDVLVVDDDLLKGEKGSRARANEAQFPQVFLRDNALWVLREVYSKEQSISTAFSGTNPFDKDRIYVSPDGQYVVVWQYTPEQEHKIYLVESSPADQIQPKVKAIQCLKPGDRIRIDRPRMFDLTLCCEISTQDDLFQNPYNLTNAGWDKSSKEYRFIFNERGHQRLRIIAMGVDGRIRVVVDESSKTFIDYSTKLYRHFTDTDEVIWASERDGWNHLYLYDVSLGSLKNQITSGDWVVRSVDRVDEKKRQIWFSCYGMVKGQDPYYAQSVRVNFDGSDLTLLTEGDGTHSCKWSPDYRYLIDTWSRVDCPPTVALRDGNTGSSIMVLQESQLSRLLDAQWNAVERFSTTARDGVTIIYGIIIRPADFDPAKSYPIFEEMYAGPHGYFCPKSFSSLSWLRYWANLGYVVVRLDGMGTNWRSKSFHDVCYKNLQDGGFPDRIKWMKEAAATRPWMDISRVGLRGGSAGGQSAGAALIHHGDFYKAAAADCGCHDNRMDKIWWSEQWMGWPVDKSYEEASNVVNAEKLQGNLMLVVGDMDDNVDPSSTFQFANALNKAGKIYEMLVLPGGKHCCGGNTEYGRMRHADFFKRHLQEKRL